MTATVMVDVMVVKEVVVEVMTVVCAPPRKLNGLKKKRCCTGYCAPRRG